MVDVEGVVDGTVVSGGTVVPAGAVVVVPGAVGSVVVDTGSVVEVWAAPLEEGGQYAKPRILVADATVVSVARDDSMMGGGASAVELVIPRADVAATLAEIKGVALAEIEAATTDNFFRLFTKARRPPGNSCA